MTRELVRAAILAFEAAARDAAFCCCRDAAVSARALGRRSSAALAVAALEGD